MALNVESLEERLVPTTISLNGNGDLFIESLGSANDNLQIHANVGTNTLIINDPGQLLTTGILLANGSGTHSVQIPFSSFVTAKQLIVNTFGGNDFVQLMVSGGDLNLSPVIDTGDGNDVIQVSGNVLTANGDVSLIGDTITILNNSRIANFGTGDIHFQANQSITLQNGSRLETKGGNILLDANQAVGGPTSGNFVGIQLIGATIVASPNGASGATGNITLKGRGGDAAGGQQTGVLLDMGGGISSTITGGSNTLLTIIGTGGASLGSGNLGLLLANGSTLSSIGGDVDVTGQGGGVGSSDINYGVMLKSGGQITSGGTGKVTVQGTGGGTASGRVDAGVMVENNSSRITSGGGDVFVTGLGGNGADYNVGVWIQSGGEISAGGVRKLNVQGTGGGTTDHDFGVYVQNGGSKILSNGGDVTVTGNGSATAFDTNYGVFAESSGLISAGGNGKLTVSGTGQGMGGGNFGVRLGSGSTINSNNGNVQVSGFGSTVGSTGGNYGIEMDGASMISAGGMNSTVTINGTGGGSIGTASGGSEVGVELEGNSQIRSSGGDVTVVGNGGGQGMSGNNFGVWLHPSGGVITAPGAGKVNVIGNGGTSSGSFNHGLLWEGNGSDITSGGGSVSVTGKTTAGPDNFAIAVYRDNVVLNPATTNWNGGIGTVLIRPQTAGTPIDVGGQDVPRAPGVTLGLTDAELDQITAGQIMLGDPMSGLMTVSSAITQASHLSLVSGAGITINQPITLGPNRNLFAQVVGSGASRFATVNADLAVSGTGMMSLSSTNLKTAVGSSLTTAGGPISLTADLMVLDGKADAGSGMIQLFAATAAKSIDLGAMVDDPTGPLALSAAELDNLTAGTISIGNDKGGAIVISATIDRAAATHLFLATSQDNNITFNATGLLNANGGDVSLLIGNLGQTAGAGAIVAGAKTPQIIGKLVSLGAKSGGIGDKTTALTFNAISLRTRTEGNGNQFLREVGSVTLAPEGLTAGTGTITLAGGSFTLGGSDRISDASDLAITNDATLDLGPNNELIDQLQLLRGSITGNGTLTGTSTFDLRSGSISANLAGKNVGVTKSAGAKVTLSGDNNSYTGPTIVTAGPLALVSTKTNNTISSSSTIRLDFGGGLDVTGLTSGTIVLASGQTLKGTGTITGKIVAGGGSTIAPGTSPGILNTGDVTLSAGSTFLVEINGATPGTEHDQLNVTGTVDLGGATLSVSGTIRSTLPGQEIVLINNNGNAPINGTFNGLDDRATVTINGVDFRLTYFGNDGNDVTLTIIPNTAAPAIPTDADRGYADTVPEGALEGSRVGITLSAVDPQGDRVFYRLTNDADGRFAIDPLTGVVTVKKSRLLDFKQATEHTIRAVAVDASGNASLEAEFTIKLTPVPADALPLASILPAQASVVEGDTERTFVSFIVKLNKPSTQTITIDFATRVGDDPTFQRPDGISADAPFATDLPGPWDFFKTSGRLTFDPGVTEQTLRVQIRPDDVPEANELFFVQLQSPVNANLAPQQSVGTAEILDDDSGPQLIISNTQILEGDSAGQHELLFTVQMIGDLPSNTDSATADYLTGNRGIDTGVAGHDYNTARGTLTFTNLNRFQVVRIPILGDTADGSDKTVSVRLDNPSVNLRLTQADAIGTIINDDSPNVVVSIAPLDAMPREGNSGTQLVPFVITLIGKPTADVTVNYATVGGTATAGSDYIATSGSVTFTLADIARGDIQKVVSVTVRGDTIVEPNETLNVALSLPASSPHTVSINPDLAVGRVVIRNDDQAVLTEDGDAIFEELSRELTAIFNAGGGLKSNPVLLAAMQTHAVQIIQTLGLTKAIVIILDPVDFVLTDTSGRQAGYTEQTGVVNQIPGAYYSGDGAVELLIVPLPPDGIYNVQLAGLGSDYNVSTTVLDNNGTSTQFNSQNLADGATSSFAFEVGGIRPIPVGQGLAANSGSASTFGVVGLFGQFGLRLALANGQENGELSGLDLDNLNERSFELMTWLTSTVRVARRQLLEPLWQSLESPLGNLLADRLPLPTDIPPKVVDQFWSQIGQTLTGVPSGIYRLGNMLESLLPALVPNRSRSTTPTPRAGEQGQPKSAPATPGVKAKRSALERPRSTPAPSPAGRGSSQTSPPANNPNANKDKATQAETQQLGNQQSSTPQTRWLWFTFKGESPSARPTTRT